MERTALFYFTKQESEHTDLRKMFRWASFEKISLFCFFCKVSFMTVSRCWTKVEIRFIREPGLALLLATSRCVMWLHEPWHLQVEYSFYQVHIRVYYRCDNICNDTRAESLRSNNWSVRSPWRKGIFPAACSVWTFGISCWIWTKSFSTSENVSFALKNCSAK